ncbi:uncharacterized protein LOC134454738 isoform X2 [Engraulis encrasicolus]|uniref:uncharacterized protein LOC134454738 isoform X2 n=1 Tax=Engraulis encrasicolus TaxID=184585 RepID=UPI002FD60E19
MDKSREEKTSSDETKQRMLRFKKRLKGLINHHDMCQARYENRMSNAKDGANALNHPNMTTTLKNSGASLSDGANALTDPNMTTTLKNSGASLSDGANALNHPNMTTTLKNSGASLSESTEGSMFSVTPSTPCQSPTLKGADDLESSQTTPSMNSRPSFESTDENMSSFTPTTPWQSPILYSDQDSAEESTPDSEEEYVPDSVDEDTSDKDMEDEEVLTTPYKRKQERPFPLKRHGKKPMTEAKRVKDQHHPPEDCTTEDPSSDSLSVMILSKKPDGRRSYSKHFCLFCGKGYSKMARHLEQMHQKEQEVARALAFPKKSKMRRIQLDLLRKRGNRAHNLEVLSAGKGTLVPCKKSNDVVNPKEFMHCLNCQGLFKRKFLWKHMQRCNLARRCGTPAPGKNRVQALCAFAQPVPEGVNQMLWKVISVMTQDDITDTIKRDPSIIKMGEHLYNKVGSDPSKHQYIRQKLREVGRLLLYSKEVGHLKTMSDFVIPANFPHVVSAVRHVSGFSAEKNNFRIPSLALKLGHSLKKIADIIECEAMISGEKETVQNARNFKQIYDTKWNECISSSALRTLTDAKYNAPQLLPFTDDVRKLHLYLDDKQKENVRKLSAVVSQKNWASLAKGTLAQIILFNRRREGEVSKMPLTAFTSRDASSMHPDVEEALNEVEKKLCGHFQRVEIRGKCGRKVAILLTPPMVQSMELLVETRNSCFPDENQYMFGRPGTQSHFKGSDCIRIFAQNCGAKHPERLSSTKLRKHIATMSKVLNLTDTDMDLLVEFLGHDIRVHKKFYRLPEGTLQLAKITKILTALETGRLAEFKGRNLDEINIDPNETLDVTTGFADEDCSDTDPTPSQPGPNNTNKDSPSTSARDETPQTLDVTPGLPDEDCSDTDPIPSQPGANNTNKDSPSTSARDETPLPRRSTHMANFDDITSPQMVHL